MPKNLNNFPKFKINSREKNEHKTNGKQQNFFIRIHQPLVSKDGT